MKTILLGAAFLLISGVSVKAVSAEKSEEHLKSKNSHEISMKMKASMQKMMDEMKSMKMSGQVDGDFAQMMERHHQGAIEMAEMEIEHGQNPQLKAMAKKMVSDQSKEQEELIKWTDKQKLKEDSALGK